MSTRLCAFAIALGLVAACDRGEDPAPDEGTPNQPAQPAEGSAAQPAEEGSAQGDQPDVALVRIQSAPLRIAPGLEPVRLVAVALDADRQAIPGVEIRWHSLDREKLSVSEDGTLTALGPLGPAFVTASAGDVIADPLPVYVVDAARLRPPEGSGEGSGEDAPDGADAPTAAGSGAPAPPKTPAGLRPQ